MRWRRSRCFPPLLVHRVRGCGSASYIRHGWVGSEFLVARRVLPDASGIVLHGTIEGLLEPPALS